jgi:hypothetical protein
MKSWRFLAIIVSAVIYFLLKCDSVENVNANNKINQILSALHLYNVRHNLYSVTKKYTNIYKDNSMSQWNNTNIKINEITF